MIIGGGTGLVPLLRLASMLKEENKSLLLYWAQEQKEVFFEKIARKITEKSDSTFLVYTDDGSYGIKGQQSV